MEGRPVARMFRAMEPILDGPPIVVDLGCAEPSRRASAQCHQPSKTGMREQNPLEHEVARVIVDALGLEEVNAERIDPDAPLFREGLGLDSIDALEIALAVSQQFGVQLRADDEKNMEIFASLKNLTNYIRENRPSG